MATLLIEPFGGLAGDMLLAALLDLGDPRFTLADLRGLAQALVPGECTLELSEARRGAFVGAHLAVRTVETEDPPHRHLSHLAERLDAAGLAPAVRARAFAVLERIAIAEGRVHGIAPGEVHFHEVGAVDTLIDVCGAVLALERLGVTRVLATPPLTGEGTVHCAHGEMPVPVPAVVELFRGLPLRHGGGPGERLTPTGAALLAELVESFEPAGGLTSDAIGLGAGTREPASGPANLVRVQLARADAASATRTVWQLDVHLDDVTGEEIGWCLRGLREAGALDAWTTPVQMKKERPGVQVSALCRPDARTALEAVVFERTPSLGLRWTHVERTECDRAVETLAVDGTPVRIKVRRRPDYPDRSPFGARDLSPEMDDLIPFAEARGLTLREAEERVVAAYLAAHEPRE